MKTIEELSGTKFHVMFYIYPNSTASIRPLWWAQNRILGFVEYSGSRAWSTTIFVE